jgi:Arc/MetJ-type ribon-helix-helix transcriptional regulator
MSFRKELIQSAEEALAIAEGRTVPAKVKALQDALIKGEQSGEPQPFDFDTFKARKRAEFEGKD